MDLLNQITDLTNAVNLNLSQEIQTTNDNVNPAAQNQVVNVYDTSSSEESNDLLMNQIGLEIQRQGGQ